MIKTVGSIVGGLGLRSDLENWRASDQLRLKLLKCEGWVGK